VLGWYSRLIGSDKCQGGWSNMLQVGEGEEEEMKSGERVDKMGQKE
jgi:hypothetical protein